MDTFFRDSRRRRRDVFASRAVLLASAVTVVVALLTGCGGGGGGKSDPTPTPKPIVTPTPTPAPTPTPVPIAVTVTPATSTISVGDFEQFTAVVSGTSNVAANWSVAEGSAGGTIDINGKYAASATRGTYHIVAVSQADGITSGKATVTVQSGGLTGTVKSERPSTNFVGGNKQ